MNHHHVVVVGASLAGIRAVEAVRKDGFPGRITLVGAEPHLPYDRPPLSKAFLEVGDTPPDPRFRTEQHLRDELGVELCLGVAATGLDPRHRVLEVAEREIGFDALVIATGATARTLWPAHHLDGVHTLRTWDDALAVRAAMDAGARTVVIGAGFIGSEVASAARARGLPVTIVEALPVPLVRAVGEQIGGRCARLHREHGTDLRCGATVASVEGAGGRVCGVRLDDGSLITADLVVVGIGVDPCTRWLAGSGLRLHDGDRGVVADATLRVAEGVYAAGDVVHFPNPLFGGELMRLEHWTSAAEQGALAARNALRPSAPGELASVPYFWSDWYGSRIQFVGRADADDIQVVSDPDDACVLALYRRADRLIGALTIDRPTQIMKYRRLIAAGTSWTDALQFASSA